MNIHDNNHGLGNKIKRSTVAESELYASDAIDSTITKSINSLCHINRATSVNSWSHDCVITNGGALVDTRAYRSGIHDKTLATRCVLVDSYVENSIVTDCVLLGASVVESHLEDCHIEKTLLTNQYLQDITLIDEGVFGTNSIISLPRVKINGITLHPSPTKGKVGFYGGCRFIHFEAVKRHPKMLGRMLGIDGNTLAKVVLEVLSWERKDDDFGCIPNSGKSYQCNDNPANEHSIVNNR